MEKTEEERSIERTWRRWESNFKKDLLEIERFGMSWIYVAQDKEKWRAFIETVMNFQVPQSAGMFFRKLRHYFLMYDIAPWS